MTITTTHCKIIFVGVFRARIFGFVGKAITQSLEVLQLLLTLLKVAMMRSLCALSFASIIFALLSTTA